jgi:uncharacterized RDD family membrane protein YckC
MTDPPSTVGNPADDQQGMWGAPAEDPAGQQPPDASAPPPAEPAPALAPLAPTPRPGRPGATWARSLTSTPVPGPAGLTFADVPDRVIAFVLDVIVLSVVGLLLALVIGGAFGGLVSGAQTAGGSLEEGGDALNTGALLVVGIAALAVSFAYFAWSWVVLRATPGMMMLGLQIGDQADGRSISWDQALVRWLVLGVAATLTTFVVFVPDILGLVVSVAAVAWLLALLATAARSPTKQGLHDHVARTVLVKAGRRRA